MKDFDKEPPKQWRAIDFGDIGGDASKVLDDVKTWLEFDQRGITFDIKRPPSAVVRDGLDVTFSQEAMESLRSNVALFVTGQLLQERERVGFFPQRMRVFVGVEFDTDDLT